jgi:RimJ/RimL family protein N-acetyltransferase
MEFIKVDKDNVSVYAAWFEDAELHKRLCPPNEMWLTHVTSSSGQAWLCYDKGQAIAQIQLDTNDDKTGSVDLAVKPKLRGQGIGTKVLKTFLDSALAAHLNCIEARIEEDNLASQKVFIKAGFIARGKSPNEEGFLHFIYPDPEIEKLWIKEVERRLELLEQGKMKLVSGEEVRKYRRGMQ